MAVRVLVVQHGDKERVAGDPELTALGHRQAEAVACRLRGEAVTAVRTSPLRRAVETAAPIAAAVGIEATVDPRLRERLNWDGRQSIEDFLRDWARASADRSWTPPTGDSSLAAAARFLEALDDLADGTVVVVAHGGVTADVLRTLVGDDPVQGLIADGVPSCAVTTLERRDDGWSVLSIAE